MYKCEHFKIYELVPPDLYESHTEDELWSMFDPDVLKAADWLRARFGPATVNDWKWGGSFSQSGLRTPDSQHYSPTSQHTKGCGLDLKFDNFSAEQIRADLRKCISDGEHIPYITRIENNVSWLHIDTKPTGKTYLYFFNP